jgi:cupin superfamily acireductone dioxygenase involved in methionine salvage
MEMRKAFSDEKNMLKTEYEDKINCEVIKYQNLNADLEEERLKRRKVEREKRFFETEANRYKSQYQVSASTSGGSEHDVNAALKEITSMQHQLDAYKEEIKRLRQNGAASTISSGAGNLESQTKITEIQGEYIDEPTTHAKSSSSRYPVRVRVRDPAAAGAQMAPTSDISVYIEQTDLLERKIESLSKEKRELIAKNLEETKDKMELSQKLLQSERESALLKSKTTKLTLENERLERIIASNEYSKGTNIAAKSYRINIAAKSITGIENINTQTGVPTEQL